MLRRVAVVLGLTAVFVLRAERGPEARPNTNAPTKVTGDGVKTDSGLHYWDIRVGNGDVAKEGSHVRVHYTGWLTTGKKFDSSVDAGTAFRFHHRQRRGHQGMGRRSCRNEGGGQAAAAHSSGAGYGAEGYPGAIPANATLIFDVQLLGVQ